MNKIPKATHNGILDINGIKITCAVLEDETRVISERSLAIAMGVRGSGAYWQKRKKSDSEVPLPEYVSAQYLLPFVGKALKERLSKPISYISKGGKISRGYEATALPDICDVWIKAGESSDFPKSQKRIAENAYILLKGFANIGIIALIDAATGFEEIRDKHALQKILDKYLLKEYAKWAKRFPDEFYEEIFRLKNWQWKGMSINRPSVIGRYTNDIVYERIAPGVLNELKRLNPKDEKGNRKAKFQQYFTPETGVPALDRHLHSVIALMRASSNWGQFERILARSFPKLGHTIPMNFDEDI